MPHINTPLMLDVPIGLVFTVLLALCLVYREDVARNKWQFPLAITIWGATLLANLVLGVIPALPGLNWLPTGYVIASGVTMGILIKTKRSN